MNNSKKLLYRIMLGLAMMLLTGSMGCVGYVDGGPGVVDTGPDFFVFGGGYDRGRDVHGYSHRGAVSRGVAHGGGHVGGGRR
jgi:hypothetical protein